MKGQKTLFSNQSDEWSTPQVLFDRCNELFPGGFTVDVAASKENTKCKKYYTKEDNALVQDWKDEIFWCNPPYSNIKGFLAKISHAHMFENAKGALLVPARVDTKWFHEHIWDSHDLIISHPYPDIEVHFIKGRLKFGNSKNSAPFPSMLVVFR